VKINNKLQGKGDLTVLRTLYFSALVLWPLVSYSQELQPLFVSDEIVNIEIRSDFTKIVGDRTEFKEYQPAELLYKLKGEEKRSIKVMIKSRGNFRLNPDNCSFPPLMINFENSNTANTIFTGQKKIKLVTPCHGEEDLLEEYIVYKMYNRVTDMSFRARLARITYFDTGSDKKLFTRYSFFIEDEDKVAERVKSTVTDKEFSAVDIDRDNIKKMTVFQYMIGNIDWNISTLKNIVVMQPLNKESGPYAVPYDFDFSAFVDAKYTIPKGLADDIQSSRRVFLGLCLSPTEYNTTFDLFRKLRYSFEDEIKNQKYFSSAAKEKLLAFIALFYTVINNDTLLKQLILSRCNEQSNGLPGGK
jgi:hypothetical protein